MLQAKTKEQVYHIAQIIGIDEDEMNHLDARVLMGQFEPFTHLETDKPISFDQMKQIVEYLSKQNTKEKQLSLYDTMFEGKHLPSCETCIHDDVCHEYSNVLQQDATNCELYEDEREKSLYDELFGYDD